LPWVFQTKKRKKERKIDPPPPSRNFEGMGMGMGIHGEWQTHNNALTIRECHSPNGKGNDHRCLDDSTMTVTLVDDREDRI